MEHGIRDSQGFYSIPSIKENVCDSEVSVVSTSPWSGPFDGKSLLNNWQTNWATASREQFWASTPDFPAPWFVVMTVLN